MSNVHFISPQPRQNDEFHRPPLDASEVREAVFDKVGEETLARRQRSRFEHMNAGVHQAQMDIVGDDLLLRELRRDRRRIRRKMFFTARRHCVITAEKRTRIPFNQRILAYFYVIVSLSALAMTNRVGTNYLVKSGSDLYVGDAQGASLFFAVALLASVMLKVVEQRLPNDIAKNVYFGFVATIGLGAFLNWALMTGVIFAPDVGAQPLWLIGSGASLRAQTILLILSHIIADTACSYVIFWGAESMLLAGRVRRTFPNPVYCDLQNDLNAVRQKMAQAERRVGEAEDLLRRYDAALADVEESARIAYRREAARQIQLQNAAIATANSNFLNA